jgi:hypothetical protein
MKRELKSQSRTKTMAHQPGGPPVKSTTGINTGQ